jgi:hypothetical protein
VGDDEAAALALCGAAFAAPCLPSAVDPAYPDLTNLVRASCSDILTGVDSGGYVWDWSGTCTYNGGSTLYDSGTVMYPGMDPVPADDCDITVRFNSEWGCTRLEFGFPDPLWGMYTCTAVDPPVCSQNDGSPQSGGLYSAEVIPCP